MLTMCLAEIVFLSLSFIIVFVSYEGFSRIGVVTCGVKVFNDINDDSVNLDHSRFMYNLIGLTKQQHNYQTLKNYDSKHEVSFD